jgi:hypothetical protein
MPETALPPYFQIAARKYFVRHQVPVPVRMPLLCQRRIYSIQIVKALKDLCACAVGAGRPVQDPVIHTRSEQMALPASPHGPYVGTAGNSIRILLRSFSGYPLGRHIGILLPERDEAAFHVFFLSFLFQVFSCIPRGRS